MYLTVPFDAGLDIGLLDTPAGGAADVEGPHGQLGARLADGLGGQNTDGLPHLHTGAVGQIPSVALGTDAAFGTAGQRRADLDTGDAGVFDDHRHIVFDPVPGLR
jgi:hypothetical protein